MSHLAEHVIENALDRFASLWLAGYLEIVQVESREQGIVVEHLLEVRDQPARVGGVAMETAAELIVHAAIRHFSARVIDHFERISISCAHVSAQQKLERHRRRKLRSASEPAVDGIVISDDADVCRIE